MLDIDGFYFAYADPVSAVYTGADLDFNFYFSVFETDSVTEYAAQAGDEVAVFGSEEELAADPVYGTVQAKYFLIYEDGSIGENPIYTSTFEAEVGTELFVSDYAVESDEYFFVYAFPESAIVTEEGAEFSLYYSILGLVTPLGDGMEALADGQITFVTNYPGGIAPYLGSVVNGLPDSSNPLDYLHTDSIFFKSLNTVSVGGNPRYVFSGWRTGSGALTSPLIYTLPAAATGNTSVYASWIDIRLNNGNPGMATPPHSIGGGNSIIIGKTNGSSGKVQVTLEKAITALSECSLIETGDTPVDFDGKAFEFMVQPFEIRTFRVK